MGKFFKLSLPVNSMPYKLSPSSLSLMGECPRCFWLTQHNVWKRPAGIFPSLPSGMDRILKVHFDGFRDKGELPPELKDNDQCEGMILFDEPDKMSVWRSNFKGIGYEDENGNVLHGALDNLLKNGNKLVVLDYKTRGYALKEDTHEHYQDQLNIYNFLLRKNGYGTEDFAFLLFYVPSHVSETGGVIFETTLKKMKTSVEAAEELWKKALKLLDGDCPDEKCDWCGGIGGK